MLSRNTVVRGPSTEIRTPRSRAAAPSAGGVRRRLGEVQRDDVGPHPGHVHDAERRQRLRQPGRTGVIVGEPLDVIRRGGSVLWTLKPPTHVAQLRPALDDKPLPLPFEADSDDHME